MQSNLITKDQLGCLCASGPDSEKLLQGQLTCDVSQCEENNFILGAHCNQKGRVISLFYLTKQTNNNYYLIMPESLLAIAVKNLKKYSLFYKAELEIIKNNINLDKIDFNIPWITPETSNQFTPHHMGLEKLGAVSFTKGCFTGQEIIARMEHLGKLKQGLHKIQTQTIPNNPIEPNTPILDKNNKTLGHFICFTEQKNNSLIGFASLLDKACDINELYLDNLLIKII